MHVNIHTQAQQEEFVVKLTTFIYTHLQVMSWVSITVYRKKGDFS